MELTGIEADYDGNDDGAKCSEARRGWQFTKKRKQNNCDMVVELSFESKVTASELLILVAIEQLQI